MFRAIWLDPHVRAKFHVPPIWEAASGLNFYASFNEGTSDNFCMIKRLNKHSACFYQRSVLRNVFMITRIQR